MIGQFICIALASVKSRQALVLENLALRQQLAILKRSVGRPRLSPMDRLFWVLFSKCWPRWRELIYVVTPDTVVRWHRRGFRWYWTRKSRCVGRPPIEPRVRKLITQMQLSNVGWGAPRIHGELLKLGIEVSQATVSRYMMRHRKPLSQTWRAFLNNHAKDIAAIDFFTVPTATFRVLYVLLVLCHERRHIVHFNVTGHPTSVWIAQQLVEAFPFDTPPRYLLRHRDRKYGDRYRARAVFRTSSLHRGRLGRIRSSNVSWGRYVESA